MTPDPREIDPLPGIGTLPREVPPDPQLEERVVTRLRSDGLLGKGRGATLWRAAAAALIFVAGLAVGRVSTTAPTPVSGSRFVLLLQGGPVAASAADEAQTVDDYRAWAVGLRNQGRHVTGERLGTGLAVVPQPLVPPGDPVRGYFIISAASFDDAIAVARSCPHARRGGQVVVRPIDPT